MSLGLATFARFPQISTAANNENASFRRIFEKPLDRK
jgi:hypothetical protein